MSSAPPSSFVSLACCFWCGDGTPENGSSVVGSRLMQVNRGLPLRNVSGWGSEDERKWLLSKYKSRIKRGLFRHPPWCASILSAAAPWSSPFVCIFRFISLLVRHIDCLVSAPCEDWKPKVFLKHQVTLNGKLKKEKQERREMGLIKAKDVELWKSPANCNRGENIANVVDCAVPWNQGMSFAKKLLRNATASGVNQRQNTRGLVCPLFVTVQTTSFAAWRVDNGSKVEEKIQWSYLKVIKEREICLTMGHTSILWSKMKPKISEALILWTVLSTSSRPGNMNSTYYVRIGT